LAQSEFVEDMREILRLLHRAYDYPVDIEFAANFGQNDGYRLNLLQCRPLQIRGGGTITDPPKELRDEDVVLKTQGAVIGQSLLGNIDRVVFVVPSAYGNLPIRERYSVARLVGRIARLERADSRKTVLLLGPGRWGTTTPSLGVPVSFAEINRVSIICEIVAMRDDLVPDVSLGTHFFSDMVEMDILYLALFPDRDNNRLNEALLLEAPNRLCELLPETADGFEDVVRVIDVGDLPGEKNLKINANALQQKVVCYFEEPESEAD
jgi:hypothetical protein